jgi:hypothetical protein
VRRDGVYRPNVRRDGVYRPKVVRSRPASLAGVRLGRTGTIADRSLLGWDLVNMRLLLTVRFDGRYPAAE